MPDPDLLYIAGTARSGTTILAMMLGSSPEAVAPGELSFLFDDAFREDELCSCRETASTCEFWSGVRASLDVTPERAGEMSRLTRRVEHHASVPRFPFHLFRSETLDRYCDAQRRAIQAIRDAARVRTIVDSSKYAGRALALSRCQDCRLGILCLTRHPAGLLHSFRKPRTGEQPQASLPFAAAYYLYVTASLRLMTALSDHPVLEISYRELNEQPTETLSRIEEWSGLDLSRARATISRNGTFDPGHMLTANRIRKQGPVRFRSVPERTPTSRGAGALARLLAAWGRMLGFVGGREGDPA